MKLSRLLVVLSALALVLPGAASAQTASTTGAATDYVVLYASGASIQSAHRAVQAAGGNIVKENTDVGVATVRSTNTTFIKAVARQSALAGAARNVVIGRDAPLQRPSKDTIESLTAAERSAAKGKPGPGGPGGPGHGHPTADPLASLQWDMAMIHATVDGSYKKQLGSKGVRVGIIDTGVDGTHPDIAPNFDAALSRNFVTDIPDLDGPCEHPSCVDPANEDDDGHGTHVAGSIGAALNGIGIAGVAPNVTLVNIRAGQDSGYFFLQATVDALTYAGDNGIDVVNMSYFVDPWLFNCADNPADSPEQQAEQRTIIAATNRALDYANRHGVTLISAEGNEATDLDNPTVDDTSPDYPVGSEYHRAVNSSCLTMPTMGHHVISVGAVGPSTMKADYSNYSFKYTDVTAPGGWFRDGFGTDTYRTDGNEILSTMPENVALVEGAIETPGGPVTAGFEGAVIRDCEGGTCAYYQYLQGTSMASPHAVGVAALIVSQFGKKAHGPKGQLGMNPDDVEKILEKTATDHACPVPATIDYTIVGRPASWNATCEGSAKLNNIWGDGIVDALKAISGKK